MKSGVPICSCSQVQPAKKKQGKMVRGTHPTFSENGAPSAKID
jgi:hypothetical protein